MLLCYNRGCRGNTPSPHAVGHGVKVVMRITCQQLVIVHAFCFVKTAQAIHGHASNPTENRLCSCHIEYDFTITWWTSGLRMSDIRPHERMCVVYQHNASALVRPVDCIIKQVMLDLHSPVMSAFLDDTNVLCLW